MDSETMEKSNNSETGESTMDSSPVNNNSINIEEVKKVHSVNSASSEDHEMEVDGEGSSIVSTDEKKSNNVEEKDVESTVGVNNENSSPNHKENCEKDSSKNGSEDSVNKEQNSNSDTIESVKNDTNSNTENSIAEHDTSCGEVSDKSAMELDVSSDKDTSVNEVTSTASPKNGEVEVSHSVKEPADSSEVSVSKTTSEASPKTDSNDQEKEKTTFEAPENKDAVKDTKESDDPNKESQEKDTVESKEKSTIETKGKDTIESKEKESPRPEGKSKKEGESGKKKKSKSCEECGVKKGLKFQVLFKGKTRFLCSDTCFKNFKFKQMQQKASEASAKEPSSEKESCFQCQKEISINQGFYPLVGEIKALCSEECLKKHNKENLTAKSCSQCKKVLDKPQDPDVLTWETMIFCNEDCLGKFQSYLGSHCTCCQSPVPQASLGKYSVCFGADIRQFCSCSCLDEFKKNLKVCSFCQTDLSAGVDSFLAPVGDKGQFKDFCSQNCMERYEVMNNISKNAPQSQMCTFCKKQGTFKIQVKLDNETFSLCSELCVAGFRCSRKIKDKMCDTCYNFFNMSSAKELSFKFDGSCKHFCTKACMTLFVLSHRKIVACVSCKVKKYNFDMIEKIDAAGQTQIFCSLNCLSLYRVSVNAVSSKNVRCDHCGKNLPAQYHLTMSDGSVRNFCTYNCVIVFQNQYTNVCTLTTTTASRQTAASATTVKTTAAGNTPVISNVVSLAPVPRGPAPTLIRNLVPPKMVQPRPSLQPVAIIGSKIYSITPAAGPPKFDADPQQLSTYLAQNDSKPGAATMTASSPLTNVTNTAGQQVIREVIVKPPAPKSQKNKSVACKPIMLNKGINVKPTPCHKAVQTDDSQMPYFIPIPVPVYIPTPLVMFSRPVPCPVPFPVPIPVPLILPSKELPSKENVSSKAIEETATDKVSQENCASKNDKTNDRSKPLKENDESEENADERSSLSSDYNDITDGDNDEYGYMDGKSSHKRPHPGSPHKTKSRKRTRMDDMVIEEAKAHIIPQSEENHNAVQNDQPDAVPHLKVP